MKFETKPTRREVPCTRRGRPSYKWVDAVYVIQDGVKLYPPMRIREAQNFIQTAKANARLMASAPDMHKALEDIENVLKNNPLAEVGNSTVHYALRRARAALAKAKGEQP